VTAAPASLPTKRTLDPKEQECLLLLRQPKETSLVASEASTAELKGGAQSTPTKIQVRSSSLSQWTKYSTINFRLRMQSAATKKK
jgi:hypothetical protein